MKLPTPVPGLVLRYAYLWRREHQLAQEEGRKDRPCAVVLASPAAAGGVQVYILPITHSPPTERDAAIEIPRRVKQHLGLDDARSWIVVDEVNDFLWPGHDLRPIPGSRPTRVDYGVLPPRYFDTVRTAFFSRARDRLVKRVSRD